MVHLMQLCSSLAYYLDMVTDAQNSEDPLGWRREVFDPETGRIHRISLGQLADNDNVFFFEIDIGRSLAKTHGMTNDGQRVGG